MEHQLSRPAEPCRSATDMCFTLLQNVELTEGRTPHPALKQITLPVQRVIRARHELNTLHDDPDQRSFRRLIPVLNPFLESLGFRSIPPLTDDPWPEINRECANALMRKHLQFGMAYRQQLRDDRSVDMLTDRLLSSSFCYFSNFDAMIRADGSIDMGLDGELITDYTFEFGMMAFQRSSLTLFLSLDED